MESQALTIAMILGALAMFAGALVQGCTGFGIALVSVPILMLLFPHDQVPVIVILVALFNNLMVLWETRKSVRVMDVIPLIIGGVIGLPFGAHLLLHIDPTTFKIGVGVLVVVVAILLLSGWRARVKHEKAAMLPVGIVSGILKASTSIGGPPIVLFLSNQGADKMRFRASLVAYFVAVDTGAIITWWLNGLVTKPVVQTAAIFLVPVLFGTYSGILLARRLHEELFKKIVLVLVSILGLGLLINSLVAR